MFDPGYFERERLGAFVITNKNMEKMMNSKFEKAVKEVLKSESLDERDKARVIAELCNKAIKRYYKSRPKSVECCSE